MRRRDVERVHQANHIGDERAKVVSARWGIGFAVTALVISEDAKTIAQRVNLAVPHGKICRQRIREDQPGRAAMAIDPIVELDTVGFNSHISPLSAAASWSDNRQRARVKPRQKSCNSASSAFGDVVGMK